MGVSRVIAGSVAAVMGIAALVAVPAIGAPGEAARARRVQAAPRAIGSFTPAAADPRLSAALARAGIGSGNFRFTPTDARRDGNRAITVAVRARGTGIDSSRSVALAAPTSVSLAPIAYNLGAAVGWKRFALSGDVTKVDLGTQPGSREAVDLGVSYVGNRASARVAARADRPLAGTVPLTGDAASYSLDVGGSYALTRNLAVTAGVRYKEDRDRLARLRDDRRDSQAVYVGTAFRF
ncbi:MAG: hypothetical protein V4659_08495 [Pseudomonadota bacterium]